MYVHVPAAWLSLQTYIFMAVTGFIALVWKVKIMEIASIQSAPVGAFFTIIALVTGMIWGKPTWGTYWVWDARLTSELILLFLYIGAIVLYASFSDKRQAVKVTSLLATYLSEKSSVKKAKASTKKEIAIRADVI